MNRLEENGEGWRGNVDVDLGRKRRCRPSFSFKSIIPPNSLLDSVINNFSGKLEGMIVRQKIFTWKGESFWNWYFVALTTSV